ncbi:hypothetical protein AB0N62_07115 [Streptomyces sp. NPDC093982]|jgi:hypothetical protein|uniref:hypothetical protein n=1 Tax=Streptomyces sp. NPDC093982 TaxID=3155077 RepID=UPI00344031A2
MRRIKLLGAAVAVAGLLGVSAADVLGAGYSAPTRSVEADSGWQRATPATALDDSGWQ